jgi:hypothetical protein
LRFFPRGHPPSLAFLRAAMVLRLLLMAPSKAPILMLAPHLGQRISDVDFASVELGISYIYYLIRSFAVISD